MPLVPFPAGSQGKPTSSPFTCANAAHFLQPEEPGTMLQSLQIKPDGGQRAHYRSHLLSHASTDMTTTPEAF